MSLRRNSPRRVRNKARRSGAVVSRMPRPERIAGPRRAANGPDSLGHRVRMSASPCRSAGDLTFSRTARMAHSDHLTQQPVLLGGKYRLGPVIGSGGVATVYRATHIWT